MFPLIRLRLRALRVRLLDRTIRRLSRRHQALAAVAGMYVARRAAQRVRWRGTVQPGTSLLITVRRPGSPAEPGDG